jgi:hypothetical protein
MWLPGFDFQACPGEEAVDQVRPALDLLQLSLAMRTRPSGSAAAKLTTARLSSDQMPSAGLDPAQRILP